MNSIRRRTIAFLVLALLCVNAVFGMYIYDHTHEEMEEVFNAQQAQLARTIDSLITNTPIIESDHSIVSKVPFVDESAYSATIGHHYERKIAYQVWDLSGNLLLMSENAPLHPLAATAPGFSQINYNETSWHIFALYSVKTEMWIYTAQREEARDELIELITKDYLIAISTVNILILAIVIFGVIFGTRPITHLSRELTERSGSNLSPLTLDTGQELEPIKNAINQLLERVEHTLTQEKNFNADLAHELRTPLAAIKIHTQNIELKEQLSDETSQSLGKVVKGVEQMSHTIEQLLLLNKLESKKNNMTKEEVGLHDLAKETISLLPSNILAQYDFELKGSNPFIQGNNALLGTMLRNLLENAYKYSPPDSHILVSTGDSEGSAFMIVTDNGPGMTDKQKENAIERHYRVSDTQSYGSGLGLSIVQKIVALHRAELSFQDGDKNSDSNDEGASGLKAHVNFTI